MSDQIVVMRAGRIEQIGGPGEIYDYPRTSFVADFVGSANLVTGRLRPDLAAGGLIAIETEGGPVMHGVAHGRAPGPDPTFSVRTVHLHLTPDRPPGERNVWPVTVERTIFLGDITQAHVTWGQRDVVVRHTRLEVAAGRPAYLSVDPERCVLLEAAT
jgi:ABC-type Fe3+/spermidine/putrescine transport system ATPase subunit